MILGKTHCSLGKKWTRVHSIYCILYWIRFANLQSSAKTTYFSQKRQIRSWRKLFSHSCFRRKAANFCHPGRQQIEFILVLRWAKPFFLYTIRSNNSFAACVVKQNMCFLFVFRNYFFDFICCYATLFRRSFIYPVPSKAVLLWTKVCWDPICVFFFPLCILAEMVG